MNIVFVYILCNKDIYLYINPCCQGKMIRQLVGKDNGLRKNGNVFLFYIWCRHLFTVQLKYCIYSKKSLEIRTLAKSV